MPWDVVAVLAVAEPAVVRGVARPFEVRRAAVRVVERGRADGTVVVRNGSAVLAPTRLAPGGVVDALVDLVCDVPAVGPAPGVVVGGAPVLFGSVAVAVLVPFCCC